MKKYIYNFLDIYFGDGVICKPTDSEQRFILYSDSGVFIFSFYINEKENQYIIFRNYDIIGLVENFFPVNCFESWEHLTNWFCDKHGIEEIPDLLKFSK